MARDRLVQLIKVLNEEIRKGENLAEKTHQSAIEIARASANSPSQSGDREHSLNQAWLAKESLQRLVLLKEEIVTSIDQTIEESRPPCYMKVEFDTGQRSQFFVVKNPINLEGYKFVSSNSPLGRATLGKGPNLPFDYKIQTPNGERVISGKILSIE